MRRLVLAVSICLAASLQAACYGPTGERVRRFEPAPNAGASLDILAVRTVPDIGAGQGAALVGDLIYLYGDADTGIIREYTLDRDAPDLVPTGRAIELTRGGENILPHPTGLTHHPEHGTFLGDTVRQRGVIWTIDLDRALADGSLDHAVLNQTVDDLARNGTRPELVRYGGQWLVATASYGPESSLRFLRPDRLASVSRTSTDAIARPPEMHEIPGTPFTQTIHWIEEHGIITLVQNRTAGRGFRLTFLQQAPWRPDVDPGLRAATLERLGNDDELEGFLWLGDGLCLLLTAHARDNLLLGRLTLPDAFLRSGAGVASGPRDY
jgi:hypothetical protein